MLKIGFHNVGIQYVKYVIHTFCVYVVVLCWIGGDILELDT